MIVVEEVEINGNIDEALFVFPQKEGMTKLDFLVGEWDVSVNQMSRRRTWTPSGNTTSSFIYRSKNLIEETIDYETSMPSLLISSYTFNEETNIYRVSIFNDFYSTIDVYEGTFDDKELVLDNTNVKIGDKQDENAQQSDISEAKNVVSSPAA